MSLAVAHLSARRGARQVLTDVSFTARPGEILGVIGPNGAGKTTLFECVAGLLPFDSGKVDNDLLFYVPDAIRPWPDQTVRWTLELTARMFDTRARRNAARRSRSRRAATCDGRVAVERGSEAARHRHRPRRAATGSAARRAVRRTRSPPDAPGDGASCAAMPRTAARSSFPFISSATPRAHAIDFFCSITAARLPRERSTS